MSHFVYLLRCADGSLYTGYTTDIKKRVHEHNGELHAKAGARYTRGRRPVRLVYTELFETRSEALRREASIKNLSKKQKESLISETQSN